MHSRILGFDYRLTPDDEIWKNEWTAERRDQYLLNPSVGTPLSVDTVVWPSQFCFQQEARSGRSVIPRTAEDFHHQGLRLWASLDELVRAVAAANR
jgi:hypothetical protein